VKPEIHHITLTDCAPQPIECVCTVTKYPADLKVQSGPEVTVREIHIYNPKGDDILIESQSEWMDYVPTTPNGYLDHATFGQIQDQCEDRINTL
jgi:hypothetical protein